LTEALKKKKYGPKKNEIQQLNIQGNYDSLPPPHSGYEWVPNWTLEPISPFRMLCVQFETSDFSSCISEVERLQAVLRSVRRDDRTLEPMHVQFVGIPRQGKTQFAMRIMMLLEKMGLHVVERTSEDNYFDDLNKHKVNMSREKDAADPSKYKHYPEVLDPAERIKMCQIDAVLLDEFNSKTKHSDDLSTLLNGVTCMPWRPLVADPRGKGETYKPVLWLTTANHELTEHDYNVTALLKRVHLRIILENGRVYVQGCHRILEPSKNFLGGFETCQGTFGKFRKERKSRTVVTETKGSEVSVKKTETSTGVFYDEILDSRILSSFVCDHCVEYTYPEMISKILAETTNKLDRGVRARDAFLERVSDSERGSLISMESL